MWNLMRNLSVLCLTGGNCCPLFLSIFIVPFALLAEVYVGERTYLSECVFPIVIPED